MMASLNQYVHMHSNARDITQSLEKLGLLSSHCSVKGICQVYAWHISSAGVAAGLFLFSSPLPDISGLPTAQGRFRLELCANQIGLGDRQATHSRLGPAKGPQPGVDLINMAAPA